MTKQTMGPGDRLVKVGAILFLVGAAGTVATVAPLLLGTNPLPTPAYFVSMLMGVGMAVALVGLLRMALGQRRAAADAAPAGGPQHGGGLPGAGSATGSGGQAAAGL